MSTLENNDCNIPIDPDDCYETVASQEEIYLEADEEEVREVLAIISPSPSQHRQSKILASPKVSRSS